MLTQARETTLHVTMSTPTNIEELDLTTVAEAAERTGKTVSNIRYYLQEGKISRYNAKGEKLARAMNGELRVSMKELNVFLSLIDLGIEKHHRAGLHPELGFYNVPEYKRTKHVHRLHPYLGKFIPQLVEWFLARYFREDDIILDPFMGSGTTLVQANELKMHALGIDISPFNCLIAKVKLDKYDVQKARYEILDIEKRVTQFSNAAYEPSSAAPLFADIDHSEKENPLSDCKSEYLRSWYDERSLAEMLYYKSLIPEYEHQDLLRVVLSRAVRSSRLVPHYDLATPKKPLPIGKKYWCKKHNRYCVPIDNCLSKIHAYSEDTARRIAEFDKLRSSKMAKVIQADSRQVNLIHELNNTSVDGKMIDGIFTSPPYVGQIDYHDQHIYAYELFGFPRYDDLEIGAKKKGKTKQSQQDYIEGIASVFRNVLQYLKNDAKVFIVANDKFHLYPEIAKQGGLKILDEFHRAVTKRTEQGDDPYQETIFLMMKSFD